jgi:hypothetical protein
MLAAVFSGLSFSEAALVIAGIGYVVSLAKDWRPVKTLRAENRELRELLTGAQQKITDLEGKVKLLEGATDLSVLQAEHKRIAETLDHVGVVLDRLDGAVRSNTAAIEAVARSSEFTRALKDHGDSRQTPA